MSSDRVYFKKKGIQINGDYVLYWMQQSQRIDFNHALITALETANDLQLPLVVCFVFTTFPEAQERHYLFMYQAIKELSRKFAELNINFVSRIGNPIEIIQELSLKAKHLFMDYGYLRIQRQWRQDIISTVECDVTVIESDVIVPVKIAYQKEAWSAGVLRPKIHTYADNFLKSVHLPELKNKTQFFVSSCPDWQEIINNSYLNITKEELIKQPVFIGGEVQANKKLDEFIETKLQFYANQRNDPSLNICSDLSPYLHFGQISVLKIALEILKTEDENSLAFFEELFVRRELAMNFVYYNPYYDNYCCLPDWAKKTLNIHKDDHRQIIYSLNDLEKALTHDEAWNSAQKEMLFTGKMHNYMRMYWGKKILEWSESPETAFETALYLNNKYNLDGRDANSFAGVAWCFGKHDRAWNERSIFGTVRYMNYDGLKRKFNIDDYCKKITSLTPK